MKIPVEKSLDELELFYFIVHNYMLCCNYID